MENRKITIFHGKIHYKWAFSIAMLNYQRVSVLFVPTWRMIWAPTLQQRAPGTAGSVEGVRGKGLGLAETWHDRRAGGNGGNKYSG